MKSTLRLNLSVVSFSCLLLRAGLWTKHCISSAPPATTHPPSIRTSAIRVLVRPRIMATCLPRELTEINMRKVAAQGFWSHSTPEIYFCFVCAAVAIILEHLNNTTLRFLELSFSGKLALTCLINVSI